MGYDFFLTSSISQIPVYSSVFNVTGSSSNFKNLSSNKSRQGEDVTINGNNEPHTLYPRKWRNFMSTIDGHRAKVDKGSTLP